MSLTILIPIKNETEIIENTLLVLENSWLKEIDHEIIFLDDYSEDDTFQKIKNYTKKSLNIKIVKNIKKGLGSAIHEGVKNSSKNFFTIFMSDLSDSLDDLKKYYDTIKDESLDSVFGSRFIEGSNVINYPTKKLILNRIANNIIRFLFLTNYNDFTNAFKIYKTSTLKSLFPFVSESFNIFLELPLKIISRKYSYKIIPISWTGRKKGSSKFNIKELGSNYIFTLIYCFSEKILLKKQKQIDETQK